MLNELATFVEEANGASVSFRPHTGRHNRFNVTPTTKLVIAEDGEIIGLAHADYRARFGETMGPSGGSDGMTLSNKIDNEHHHIAGDSTSGVDQGLYSGRPRL